MSSPMQENGRPSDSSTGRAIPSTASSSAGATGLTGSVTTIRPPAAAEAAKAKKKRNRKNRKNRRKQSFAFNAIAPSEDGSSVQGDLTPRDANTRPDVYGLRQPSISTTSIDSEVLLDHREQQPMRPRRSSTSQGQSRFEPSSYRPSYTNPFMPQNSPSRRDLSRDHASDDEHEVDERAPLIGSMSRANTSPLYGYGSYVRSSRTPPPISRRPSSRSSAKSRRRNGFDRLSPAFGGLDEYHVNHPPSMPGSPQLGGKSPHEVNFGDYLMRDEYADENRVMEPALGPEPVPDRATLERRHTISLEAEEDVCFPIEGMSELAEEELMNREGSYRRSGPRRRRGKWPDLAMFEEWSRFEKEGRSEERRVKRITEPQLIGGRLRPIRRGWHRAEDDVPYRFTYFNEEFQSTIHSQTISELVQPGASFQQLFIPDPPELSDSSSEEEQPSREDSNVNIGRGSPNLGRISLEAIAMARQPSLSEARQSSGTEPRAEHARAASLAAEARSESKASSASGTPSAIKSPRAAPQKPKRYGDRPTWWLDVMSPTEAEMKVISKTFGIHPLTAEDIIMQETREKVELFRHYYFVSYRSFEQDINNAEFLEPVNMYVVVFREGVISFHFSMTPHPANVRRRIRQLKDYLILSSDWISYAIIDDITDAFAPLIQTIEDEVDDIDDAILELHTAVTHAAPREKADGDGASPTHGGDMLRRVGECRKKVMGLYRLLGTKADVIKGFAKRCNEHWDVAPRSEIGLYLGDIQDHIVTMTQNLSHYEKILARSHANYLAQINIRMNERQEETTDVLGKLTVLGTIVLPMNIITGLWGMNVWVPGQEAEGNLTWFWCITAGLVFFGLSCFYTAKLFKIV